MGTRFATVYDGQVVNNLAAKTLQTKLLLKVLIVVKYVIGTFSSSVHIIWIGIRCFTHTADMIARLFSLAFP